MSVVPLNKLFLHKDETVCFITSKTTKYGIETVVV